MAIRDELSKSKIIPEDLIMVVNAMDEIGAPIENIINTFLKAKDTVEKNNALSEEERKNRIGIYDTIIAILKKEQLKDSKVNPIDKMKAFLVKVRSYPENKQLYTNATLELMNDDQIKSTFDVLSDIIGKDEVERLIAAGEDAVIKHEGSNWTYAPTVPINDDPKEEPITMDEKRKFVSKLCFASGELLYSEEAVNKLSDELINVIYERQLGGLSDDEVRALIKGDKSIPIHNDKPKDGQNKGETPKGGSDSHEPTDEDYNKTKHDATDPEPDSSVREGNNDPKRISKLAKNKTKIKEYFLKGLVVVTLFSITAPLTIISGIGYVKYKKSILDGTLDVPPFVRNAVEWFDNLGKGKLKRTRKPKAEPEEEVHEESKGRSKA